MSTIDDLYAQVYANPEDTAARLVLADALQEVRDPRGELIALQHQRAALKEGPSKRERQLLKKHETEFLGRIEPAVLKKEPILFELGFVARMAFRNHAKGRERIGDPSWSTVQWLDLKDTDSLNRGARLLLSEPVRKWLRTAWNVRLFDAMTIAEGTIPVSLHELDLVAGMDDHELTAQFFEQAAASFKDVRRVILEPARQNSYAHSTLFGRLLDSAFGAQLDELIVRGGDIGIWGEDATRALAERLGGPAPKAGGPRRIAFSTRAGRITLGCHDDHARSTISVMLVAGEGDVVANQITKLRHPRIKKVHVYGHTHSDGDMRFIRAALLSTDLQLEVSPPV